MAMHVPAWKRLGLQLKSTSSAIVPAEPVRPSKMQKLSNDEQPAPDGDRAGSKLVRINCDQQKAYAAQQSKRFDVEANYPQSARLRRDSQAQQPVQSKKRKSVSFDVQPMEVEGGSTAQTAASEDSTNGPHTEQMNGNMEPHSITNDPPKPPKKEKKPKKEKTKKQKDKPKSEPLKSTLDTQQPQPKAYQAYLTTHHTTRQDWKFNKNHQTKILENIFNLHRLPASYDTALVDYVSGLRGVSARERLGEEARRVVGEAEGWGVDGKEENGEGKEGVGKADEFKAQQLDRAKAILEALENSTPAAPTTTANQAKAPPAKDAEGKADADADAQKAQRQQPRTKRSRGRKRRTAEVSNSSSSSSSELRESSSDEGESDG